MTPPREANHEANAMASREADTRARVEAQTVFDAPFVLEAGAGTGKTTALIARIISWIMGPGWTRKEENLRQAGNLELGEEELAASVMDGVVAITFTEAAAAEMETRTGQVLSEIARGKTPAFLSESNLPSQQDQRERRADSLLTALEHLQVHTIHAWCSRILARFPLEAGLHPNFQVDADGAMRREVTQEVIEEHLHSAYTEELGDALGALAQDGRGPGDLADALNSLIEHGVRSEELRVSPFAPEELERFSERLLATLRQLPQELVAALQGIPRNPNSASFGRWISSSTAQLVDAAPGSRAELERFLESILNEDLDGAKKRLRDWRKGDFSGGEKKALDEEWKSLLQRTAPGLLRAIEGLEKLRPRLLEAALETLAPLLDEVESRLRANGITSYQDLLTLARDLLRDRAAVRRILRREIDQILVDEFQDTNQLQCEIIRQLALQGPAEERPGLFLVGDPKQSIYGWRGADLSAYDRFVRALEEPGRERRRLSVNFRSVPSILTEVNRAIGGVMQAHEELQPPYQALLPSEENADAVGYSSETRRPIEHWVSSLQKSDEWESMTRAETTELEARALAADLRELKEEEGSSFQWSDVGLLFRSSSDLEIYLTELRRARIPYSVERDRHYFRRREILDATALLSCVVEPADHLSLLAFLRSPWVGVPDAALLGLWQRGFPHDMTRLGGPDPALVEKLTRAIRDTAQSLRGESGPSERIEGWEDCLCLAIRQLAALRASLRTDRAEDFVRKLRQWTQVEARDGSRYLGLYRVANLERFFRQLRDALCRGRDDARAYLSKLRRGIAEGLQTQDVQLQVGARDAVRVMTIHKAKGLDFSHVYLLQCDKNPPPPHNAWKGTKIPQPQEGLQILLMGYPSLDYALAKDRSELVEGFERVRLLYVALTRAKRRLVVAGGRSLQFTGPGERARNFAELLAPRARASRLQDRARESVAAERDFFLELAEPDELLWRLLPSAELSPGSTAAAQTPSTLGLTEVLQDGELLRLARERARQHQALPFHRAASKMGESEPLPRHGAGAEDEELPPSRREVAQAVGTAIHRGLQDYAFSRTAEEAFAELRATAHSTLRRLLAAELHDEALERCETILEAMRGSRLLARLRALEGAILGREVPILTSFPVAGAEGPVGFCPGVIDLLYRDPESGELVVADYKTDQLEGEEELRQRALHYREQGEVYCRALARALGGGESPRFELWFLRRDRIEILS